MKKFLHFGLSVYLLIAIVAIILLNYLSFFPKSIKVLSPLPDFLTYFKNAQVSTLNLWLPNLETNAENFDVSAKSALAFDLTTDKILYTKNPNQRLPMASLTKIMTAIIALENKREDNSYTVLAQNLVGENVMGLSANEILTLEELLYGLMLSSGNDAAETISSNFPGGRSEFIKAMNQKVKALGLKDTNFTNPSGLEGDGSQYTTAYDLLVISKYAIMKFPQFTRISSTFNYAVEKTSTHKAYYLENETNLITSYPGVRGIKTGYTPQAGLCLATYLEYNGHKIIGIILNSSNRRQEMKDLLDYSLKLQGIKPPPHI